jgi:beta-lactamase regulating signal transducer with metallopeptidase domain
MHQVNYQIGPAVLLSLEWSILHFLWQGTLIAILLAIMLVALKRRSAQARYCVACLALFAMSVCPVFTFLVSQSRWTVSPTGSRDFVRHSTVTHAAVAKGRAARSEYASTTAISLPFIATVQRASDPDLVGRIARWTVTTWLAGVLLMSVRILLAWIGVRRLVNTDVEPASSIQLQLLRETVRKIKVTRIPQLLVSRIVTVPTLIGGLRNIILLPAGALIGLSPQMLASLLAHELAHVRRHDYLVNLCQSAIETLLYYHPAVWWVSHVIRTEREYCCDDLVVSAFSDRQLYAQALLHLEQYRCRPLALAASDGSLLTRIRRILGVKTMNTRTTPTLWLAILVMILVAAGPATLMRAMIRQDGVAAAAAGQKADKSSATARTAPTQTNAQQANPEFVDLDVMNATMDRVLTELFRPTPFNYLLADNEPPLEASARFTGMPIQTVLDTLSHGDAFRWAARDNILVAWQERTSLDPIDKREYTGHIRLTPLADVLKAMSAIHPFRYHIDNGQPATQIVETKFSHTDFVSALNEVLAHCETPMKFTRKNGELIISPDPSLPKRSKAGIASAPAVTDAPRQKFAPPVPEAEQRYRIMVREAPFDEIANKVFQYAGKPYRIAPTVTESDEQTAINCNEVTLDEMLKAMLASAPRQKTPLNLRIENGVYVVEPKSADFPGRVITFPAIAGEKVVRSDYMLVNRPIGDALKLILDQTGEYYWLNVPNSSKTVTMRLKNATVAQALRAAIRSANIEPHLFVRQQFGLYFVVPPQIQGISNQALKDWKFTAKFKGVSARDAFMAALSARGNYSIDRNLESVTMTADFQNRGFDQALDDMARGASAGIVINSTDRQLSIGVK